MDLVNLLAFVPGELWEKAWVFYEKLMSVLLLQIMQRMKKRFLISVILTCFLLILADAVAAQCSICTKTAQQLGEGPAKGLNAAIIYLAFFPLVLIGFLGYRWWKTNRDA